MRITVSIVIVVLSIIQQAVCQVKKHSQTICYFNSTINFDRPYFGIRDLPFESCNHVVFKSPGFNLSSKDILGIDFSTQGVSSVREEMRKTSTATIVSLKVLTALTQFEVKYIPIFLRYAESENIDEMDFEIDEAHLDAVEDVAYKIALTENMTITGNNHKFSDFFTSIITLTMPSRLIPFIAEVEERHHFMDFMTRVYVVLTDDDALNLTSVMIRHNFAPDVVDKINLLFPTYPSADHIDRNNLITQLEREPSGSNQRDQTFYSTYMEVPLNCSLPIAINLTKTYNEITEKCGSVYIWPTFDNASGQCEGISNSKLYNSSQMGCPDEARMKSKTLCYVNSTKNFDNQYFGVKNVPFRACTHLVFKSPGFNVSSNDILRINFQSPGLSGIRNLWKMKTVVSLKVLHELRLFKLPDLLYFINYAKSVRIDEVDFEVDENHFEAVEEIARTIKNNIADKNVNVLNITSHEVKNRFNISFTMPSRLITKVAGVEKRHQFMDFLTYVYIVLTDEDNFQLIQEQLDMANFTEENRDKITWVLPVYATNSISNGGGSLPTQVYVNIEEHLPLTRTLYSPFVGVPLVCGLPVTLESNETHMSYGHNLIAVAAWPQNGTDSGLCDNIRNSSVYKLNNDDPKPFTDSHWSIGDIAAVTILVIIVALIASAAALVHRIICYRQSIDNVSEGELIITSSSLQLDSRTNNLGQTVATGGFGTVYRGVWNGHTVAIKKMLPKDQKYYEAEVAIMSRLSHKNIIKILGFKSNSKHCRIVMEFADCGDMDKLIFEDGIIYSKLHVVSWSHQIASALSYIHTMKPVIVHRDVKPSNLLLQDFCRIVKLCDFGISKDVRTIMTPERGSLPFMAPEVFTSQKYTEKCDVFSFGVSMWQMFSRKKPYQMPGPAIMEAVTVKHERPPMQGIDFVDSLDTLIIKCWNSDPNVRPAMKDVESILSYSIRKLKITDLEPINHTPWTTLSSVSR